MKNYLFLFTCLFLLQPQTAQGALRLSLDNHTALLQILAHADQEFKNDNPKAARRSLYLLQFLQSTNPKEIVLTGTRADGYTFITSVKEVIESITTNPTILQFVQAETAKERKKTILAFLASRKFQG